MTTTEGLCNCVLKLVVNFINVFANAFFCTNVISAAFLVTCTVEKAAKMTFVRKICTFNVDEIDTWKQNKDGEENDNLRFLDNNLKDLKK